MTIGTFTAAAIAELAFKKVLETTAGEVAKKYTGNALNLIDQLYHKIRDRLMNNPDVEPVITAIEQKQSTDITPVVPYLQAVMEDDPDFASEIRQMAEQINNIDGIDGQYVQVNSRDGYQNPDNQGQLFQGVENSTINFTINNPSAD